jgi:hypothetical protein
LAGHSDNLGIVWPDAQLDGISADYDEVRVFVEETSTSRCLVVRCVGHIGVRILGFWDETVVENARVVSEHEFLTACLSDLARRYPNEWPATGQECREKRTWRVLEIQLCDGAEIVVVAAEILVDVPEKPEKR